MQETLYASYRRDIGDGLILRWSTAEDVEQIAALHGHVHRDTADDPPNLSVARYVRAMMHGDYPFMGPGDYAVVEDTGKAGQPIVACTCLWKHIWAYEGIPFQVGRPEMVATDPLYRNRGLIRALFETVHERSEAEGDLVQAITGIAYFYRQFGYEYALELEEQRTTPIALLPAAREGEPEPFQLRVAAVEDIPLIAALHNRRRADCLVSERISRQQWLYHIETWKEHPELGQHFAVQMIVDTMGQAVGFVVSSALRRGQALRIRLLEFAEGLNLQMAMPSVLRALAAYGLTVEQNGPNVPHLREISLLLGSTHPVHSVLGEDLDRAGEPPYAWYVRVNDLPAFLMHLAPALEKRLASSVVAGYTGEMKMDFYRGGHRLVFERGRLRAVEPWRAPFYGDEATCAFPPLVFLQVLFGHRSLETLRQVFPDVRISNEASLLLKALFPMRPSFVFGW